MDRVLDLADNKCREKYLISLYEKSGIKVSNVDALKKMLPLDETREALTKGTIEFLDNLSVISAKISHAIDGNPLKPSAGVSIASIFGSIGSLLGKTAAWEEKTRYNNDVKDILRQLYMSPRLFEAYLDVQRLLEESGIGPQEAADELLRKLDL